MENYEMTTNEEINETQEIEIYDDQGKSGGKIAGGIALGVLGLVGAGAVAWYFKNRAKFEERKIEKLRKKGYVIYKEDADDVVEINEG